MVGGDKEIFEKIKPVLNVLGTNINYVGNAGSGQHAKMANQIAIAGTLASVCEAISYAKKANLYWQLVLDCISNGAAGSWQMSNNGYKMLKDDFEPGLYIKNYIKKIENAKKEANHSNLE